MIFRAKKFFSQIFFSEKLLSPTLASPTWFNPKNTPGRVLRSEILKGNGYSIYTSQKVLHDLVKFYQTNISKVVGQKVQLFGQNGYMGPKMGILRAFLALKAPVDANQSFARVNSTGFIIITIVSTF